MQWGSHAAVTQSDPYDAALRNYCASQHMLWWLMLPLVVSPHLKDVVAKFYLGLTFGASSDLSFTSRWESSQKKFFLLKAILIFYLALEYCKL